VGANINESGVHSKRVYIRYPAIDPTIITGMDAVLDFTKGTYTPAGTYWAMAINDNSDTTPNYSTPARLESAMVTGNNQTIELNFPDVERTQLRLDIRASRMTTSPPNGAITLKKLRVRGTGQKPSQFAGIPDCLTKYLYFWVNESGVAGQGFDVLIEGINGASPFTGNGGFGYGCYAECNPGQGIRVTFTFPANIVLQSGTFSYSQQTQDTAPGTLNYQRVYTYLNQTLVTTPYSRSENVSPGDLSYNWFPVSIATQAGAYNKIVLEHAIYDTSARPATVGIRFEAAYTGG
jgi:hypothetical protein